MKRFDVGLACAALALTGIGLLAIYSSGGSYYFFRQLIFVPVAIAGAVGAYFLSLAAFSTDWPNPSTQSRWSPCSLYSSSAPGRARIAGS